jgi:hypothetical protein
MNAAEVIPSKLQRQGYFQIIQLLRESVREPSESPQLHPHREVLPLNTLFWTLPVEIQIRTAPTAETA